MDLVEKIFRYKFRIYILPWLDQHIQPRVTLHNMDQEEPESNTYDDIDTYEIDTHLFQQLDVTYRL